ncbi:hypothetical protein [Streptomyces sp. NPDC057428]|uniref:hypothetical protein n=1 Tax=Streptomyces sp. NPDC057428 TaxID=3346129 RepID=UPI0036B197F4
MADGQQDDKDLDAGKDLSPIVPTVGVGWDTPPSFNNDPKGQTSGNRLTDVAESGPIRFDAAGVRATENTLLAQGRNAASGYESLRQRVDAAVHGQFWGPAHPPSVISSGQNAGTQTPGDTSWYPTKEESENADQKILADIGADFAQHINPAMQRALAAQAGALGLLGNYIAMINTSGQSYAHVDRAATFPDIQRPVTGNP